MAFLCHLCLLLLALLCLIALSPGNSAANAAPLISKLHWGSIRISGMDSAYRDVKLWPGGSRAWDWRETGTHHSPGVQPADLTELFDKSPTGLDAIVISRGMNQVLEVPEATVQFARDRGARVYVLQTEAAALKYNELVNSGQRVAGLFHSTC